MTQFPVLRLLLVDDDSIFRMGLRAACASFRDVQVAAEAETGEAALVMVASEMAEALQDSADASTFVMVLELGMANLAATLPQYRTIGISAVEFCQQVKGEYPQIPILLLTTVELPILLSGAQQAGVEGYCSKGVKIEELVQALRQVAAGETYWNHPPIGQSPFLTVPQASLSILGKWRYGLYRSGVQQIDRALAELGPGLREPPELTDGDPQRILNWLFVTGRRRELRAARWIVSQLLPETVQSEVRQNYENPRPQTPPTSETDSALVMTTDGALVTQSVMSVTELRSYLVNTTVAKIQSGLKNQTNIPLEIDILRTDQKQELILLILNKFEQSLDELKLSETQLQKIPEKSIIVLQDIWEAATLEFFGKYYEITEGDPTSPDSRIIEVIPVLLRDAPQVEVEILDKIPLTAELIAHILYQTPLQIDNLACSVGTPEALNRAEAVLQNLIIQTANAVIQPLLNYFADFEEVKKKYYDQSLLSTREIEKFRNNLSWKYRIEKFVGEPQSIFESSYKIWVIGERGLQQTVIYAPRKSELEQLSGIQLVVTLVLESRDAIAPRVRALVAFVGSGVVYILTQVVGRGIGLVGKGVLQGIGSSLQESQGSHKKSRQ